MKKILLFIPARSSSSRIKNKNMRIIGNQSLIKKKVKQCIKSKFKEIIVSTDSKKIFNHAIKCGAKSYLRPKKYSTSKSTMMSSILNFLKHLKNENSKLPDYVAILPPTYPFLTASTIQKAFRLLMANKKIISVCSYVKSYEHPFLYVESFKKLKFDIFKYKNEKFSKIERTQDYPKTFILSGALRISKISHFLKYLHKTSPYIKEHVIDFSSCKGIQISQRESFDINNYRDLKLATILNKNKDLYNN